MKKLCTWMVGVSFAVVAAVGCQGTDESQGYYYPQSSGYSQQQYQGQPQYQAQQGQQYYQQQQPTSDPYGSGQGTQTQPGAGTQQ